MTLAIVYSRASFGMTAPLVTVEVHLSPGMAGFCIVGLPETAVKESRDRIRSAFINSQIEFPCRRLTVNLAPADLPKEGGRFDLPIALGILAACGYVPLQALADYEFLGELALSGQLRPIQSILPVVIATHKVGRSLIVPQENAWEASIYQEATIYAASHLLEVFGHLKGEALLSRYVSQPQTEKREPELDLKEVRGQVAGKRALEIAAAGRHSLLLMGPPGTGKTMLANRLPGLLPELQEDEALEVAAVTSISMSGFDRRQWRKTPYRAPHHTSSAIALVGGGRPPKPGEISLAHRGILFLDELPEFNRHVLESLREPLESGEIKISRAAYQFIFPAAFQLIAAMNPCPCGYAGSREKMCECSPDIIKRYLRKLSGPLLDRIDMHVEVNHLSPIMLSMIEKEQSESSHMIRERVLHATEKQISRQGKVNAKLKTIELAAFCSITKEAEIELQRIMTKFHFSARVYHRMIKVARTIADLADCHHIECHHIHEAFSLRALEGKYMLRS